MVLKIAILIVFGLMLISLVSGLYFLMKDQGKSHHALNSLGVRVALAILLMALVGYGIVTGQLKSEAPWAMSEPPSPPDASPETDTRPTTDGGSN